MILSLTCTGPLAPCLSYLLHKHPDKVQSFSLSFGRAHVFYPENRPECSTAVLLMEIDPVGLVRGRNARGSDGFALAQYVNDRPYAASSFLCVALLRVFGSALSGTCNSFPDYVDQPMPLIARLESLPCRGGEEWLRRLFEPLGYRVQAERRCLDNQFPDWGMSPYYSLEIAAEIPLKAMLSHLYVLIPVLDNEKHYWIGQDEIEKLLRHGEGWLPQHPAREGIVNRYLRYKKQLTREALSRLTEEDEVDPDASSLQNTQEEEILEEKVCLHQQRHEAVITALKSSGATSVIDLGCGDGKLLQKLLKERPFEKIAGMDVSIRNLEIAAKRLRLEQLPLAVRDKINLLHGSLMYRDARIGDYDAAAVVEVIEHLDTPRLRAFERVVFEFARPKIVVITTPNVEFNVLFETLPPNTFRHKDHRFEWTRNEFQDWAEGVARRCGYTVALTSVGPVDEKLGAPSQMGVFTR